MFISSWLYSIKCFITNQNLIALLLLHFTCEIKCVYIKQESSIAKAHDNSHARNDVKITSHVQVR